MTVGELSMIYLEQQLFNGDPKTEHFGQIPSVHQKGSEHTYFISDFCCLGISKKLILRANTEEQGRIYTMEDIFGRANPVDCAEYRVVVQVQNENDFTEECDILRAPTFCQELVLEIDPKRVIE